ncbi:MAG: hypothetical protein AB7T49_08885 [Oligoflexales bacterium]
MSRNNFFKTVMALFATMLACGENHKGSDVKIIGTDLNADGTASEPMRIYYIENHRVVRADCTPDRPVSKEFCRTNIRKMLQSKFEGKLFEDRKIQKNKRERLIAAYDEQIRLGREQGLDVHDLEEKRNTLDGERNGISKEIAQIENLMAKMETEPLVYRITAEGDSFPEFKPYVKRFPEIFRSAYLVTAGDTHTCITDNEGVKCWGGSTWGGMAHELERYLSGRTFKNPVDMVSGDNFTCVLDDRDIFCFGPEDKTRDLYTPPPGPVETYTKLYGTKTYVCGILHNNATGKDKINCGGKWYNGFGIRLSLDLDLGDVVITAEDVVCVITAQGKQKCLADTNTGRNDFPYDSVAPQMFSPVRAASTTKNACAIHEDGLVCWQNQEHAALTIPEAAKAPRELSSFEDNICTINLDKTVSCFGASEHGQTNVPSLRNAVVLSAGTIHTCALDDAGLKCWGPGPEVGHRGQANVPDNLKFDAVPRR